MTDKALFRSLRLALCALLLFVVAVGCRAPFLVGRTTAPGGVATARGPVDDGVRVVVGTPVELPVRSAATAGGSVLPAALAGQPYGAVSISVAWPARPKYGTQAIPLAANSLRFRIIGSDGKDRLAVWFFRPTNGQLAEMNQIFFLPVQTGMLVEVRAYAQTQSQVTTPLAAPPYNPPNMPDFAANDGSADFRVLAEGLQFNFAVGVLKSTPVQVTLDSTQLVAGIGGAGAFNFGGDPYFSNFLEDARFAEMTLPGGLFHDHRGPKNAANASLGRRNRLVFLEYPVFATVANPPERDLVEILTADALGGNADSATASPFPEPVKLQLGGGSAPVPQANGDGNAPTFAIVNNPTKLAYNPGSPDRLYILQASTSASPNGVRILSPATDSTSAAVNSDPLFNGYAADTPQGLVSISAIPGSSNIMAADRASRRILIDIAQPGNQVPSTLAGGGTSPPSTTAIPSATIAFSAGIQSIAASSSSDFLVLDGSTVLRSVNGQARIVAGVGAISPVGNYANLDADNVAFGTGADMVYDSTHTYAYVADEFDKTIYRLGPMPTALGAAVPFLSIPVTFDPMALAASINGTSIYVLSSDGQVFPIDSPGSVSPTVETTPILVSSGSSYTGLACGTIDGADEIFLATDEGGGNIRWARATGGIPVRMFGGGSFDIDLASPDLIVGDGANLAASIVTGARPGGQVALANSGYLDGPTYLTADSTGDVYVADTKNNRVREILVDPDNTDNPAQILSLYRSDPSTTPPLIVVKQPQGVDADEYGDVFVANTGYNSIDVWRPGVDRYESTSAFGIAGTPMAAGGYNDDNINARLVQLGLPTAIRVERHAKPTDGTPSRRRVFFIDSGNKRVRMLSPVHTDIQKPCGCSGDDPYFQYIISTVAGGGSGGDGTDAVHAALASPTDLALDSNGYLYIADGSKIRRVDPVTGSIATIYTASGGLGSITVDDANEELYFTLQGQMTIRKVSLPQ